MNLKRNQNFFFKLLFLYVFCDLFLFLARRQGNVRRKYLEMVKRISFQLDFEVIHQPESLEVKRRSDAILVYL